MNRQRYSPWSYGSYMPQGSPGYNPFSKYPDLTSLVQNLISTYQTFRQMKQQRQQAEEQKKYRQFQMEQLKRQADAELKQRAYRRWLVQKFPQLEPYIAAGQQIPQEAMAQITGMGMMPESESKKTAEFHKIKYEDFVAMPQAQRNQLHRQRYSAQVAKSQQETPEARKKRIEEEMRIRGKVGQEFETPRETPAERDARIRREATIRAEVTQKFAQPTPEEKLRKGATVRRAIDTATDRFYKDYQEDMGDLKKAVEMSRGKPPISEEGYRLDMPKQYNRAVLYKRNGVATPEHENLINKYEAWFDYFLAISGQKQWADVETTEFQKRGIVQPISTFKDWLQSPEPSNTTVNANQIKEWYEIYKGFLKTLHKK